jgi:hypothetical protein
MTNFSRVFSLKIGNPAKKIYGYWKLGHCMNALAKITPKSLLISGKMFQFAFSFKGTLYAPLHLGFWQILKRGNTFMTLSGDFN